MSIDINANEMPGKQKSYKKQNVWLKIKITWWRSQNAVAIIRTTGTNSHLLNKELVGKHTAKKC